MPGKVSVEMPPEPTLYYPEAESDPWVYRLNPDGSWSVQDTSRPEKGWIDVKEDSVAHKAIQSQLTSGQLFSRPDVTADTPSEEPEAATSTPSPDSSDPRALRENAARKAFAVNLKTGERDYARGERAQRAHDKLSEIMERGISDEEVARRTRANPLDDSKWSQARREAAQRTFDKLSEFMERSRARAEDGTR